MGFLDHATNNIVIDAVLTDRGRQFLSLNNGSFTIAKFSLCDDEVDYTIIRKFGRTVGKEKITKNTPVLEAQTRGTLSCKHKLLSLGNPLHVRMPNLTYTLESGGTVLSLSSVIGNANKQRQVILSQTIQNQSSIPGELVDDSYIIKMDNRFLTIPGIDGIVDSNNVVTYELSSDGTGTALGGSRLTTIIGTRTITDRQYEINGTPSNKNVIRSYIQIFGFDTGSQLIIEAQISKTSI